MEYAKNRRLEKQLNFIIEVDRIKNIIRKSLMFDGSRFENDAEHSWTISLMALLLKEYADFAINIEKVIFMLLIHDIVELDAGDTFLYSDARELAHIAEEKAAERIYGLLDDDQRDIFIRTWKEFEEGKTNDAKFARVFDRLEPLLQNYVNRGAGWKKHGIPYERVYETNRHIENGSKELWTFVEYMLNDAREKGYFPAGE